MSIWRSPILYIGALIVLLVGGALCAPFMIDWNGYRTKLEAYGQNLSGRAVVIDGLSFTHLQPSSLVEKADTASTRP